MKMTRRSFLSASALALLSCPLAPTASAAKSDSLLAGLFHSQDTALPLKPLTAKGVDANPFMGSSESNIHHDCYNTDSTDAVLPVGICPEVHVAMEKTNPNASPAIFFDNFDNPISPFLGGLAIRDLDAEEVRTIGFFSPAKHDGGGYLIQSSYSFVDGRNLIVCPTSHNHVLMLRATDESGTPLPVFQKVLDINIKEAAERVLGRSLEQNLLSIVFDYDGNLWFVTGGFRIYPSRGQQGAMGYISRAAIDTILAGGTADLSREVHVYAPAPGEGAENGIASCREGAVILTNLACYLLRANGGVEVVWRTPYDSVGAKDSREGAATTGGGLAWGGGCSPSLSRELVFFTDNLEVVSLMAVDIRTGEVVASHPVIDELPDNMPVSVENSAIVYDHGDGRVSTIVCNWFGAGSPNLAKPDSDSSIQSYENIYDRNWLLKGNCMIMPGVERVDTVRTADGWAMKSIWCRDDLSDTSMMKLSTHLRLRAGCGQRYVAVHRAGLRHRQDRPHGGRCLPLRLQQHGHRYVCRPGRQQALLPHRLQGAAPPAGPLRLPARDALPEGRSGQDLPPGAFCRRFPCRRRHRHPRKLAAHRHPRQSPSPDHRCLPHQRPDRKPRRLQTLCPRHRRSLPRGVRLAL